MSSYLSDNNRSCDDMVFHWGEWVNVSIRWNGAVAGVCVLCPCLAHAWVFAMTFQFGTCPDGHILLSNIEWQTNALVIDEHNDCSAFYGTILASQFMLPISSRSTYDSCTFFECRYPRLKPMCGSNCL